ncbi:DNA cross-link repair 1A protein isoform X2 [Carettochelys insculpta]|uniref:DNA cross-link repair 1A protein isoform X2 n=1 Tax=Carettochelys insculpta TaxID=44489 RepID=UPI003EB7123F
MSENAQLEEDIWEYKSIRKPKSAYPDNNWVNISTPMQKANDGNCKSRQSGGRNNKKSFENQDKSKKSKQGPRQKGIQPLVTPAQNLNLAKDDHIGQSVESITTPVKRSRACSKKQTPPNARPVYEGYCPSCQMPFSLLLAQTPRWHVTECLDTPRSIEKECPDGLLCSSTIPSHYKRYTHFTLATSRAGDYLVSSPTYSSERKYTCSDSAISSCFPHLTDGTLLHEKQTKNVRNVPHEDHTLVIQSSTQPKSPIVTKENTAFSANILKPKQTLQISQYADDNSQVEFLDFPFSQGSEPGEDLDNQNDSDQLKLLLPEVDCSDSEISYSPLNTDEEDEQETEEEEEEEKVKNSRRRLFHTQNSENESNKKEESTSMLFTELDCSPFQHEPKYSSLKIGGFIIQNELGEELNGLSSLDGCVKPVSQCQINDVVSNSRSAANQLEHPQMVLTAESCLSLNYDITRKESDWPKFSTSIFSTGDWELSNSDACNVDSADLVVGDPSFPLKVKEGGKSLLSRQSEVSKEPIHHLINENKMTTSTSENAIDQKSSQPVIEREGNLPSTAAVPLSSTVSKTLSSVLVANKKAKSLSAKELKQMDIGVFFGLKPKAKEEKKVEKHSGEGIQASSPVTPNGKRSRLRKRKAEGSVGDIDAVTESLNKNGVCADTTSCGQRRWRKRYKASSTEEGTKPKTCPFYKKIPGTGFTVDAFQYGEIEGCTAYFLTHFHSDHYNGLTKKFTFPIYCNKITGNLVKSKLRVQEQYVHTLPMDTECIVNGIKVVLLDANQYCSPEYTFPSQQEVIQFAINTAFETVTLNPRTLVVCGTYSIGKERIFLAIAQVLGSQVSMSSDKYKTLQCLESAAVNSLITTDWNNTLLHLLPMMQINFKGLQNHLNKFSEKFDQVLAFRPTGWTYSSSCHTLADIKPQTRGKITIYGIPYSEHSSYLEMKRFVQWLKPQKIIPTVNVGDWRYRSMMEKHFRDWKTESIDQREECTFQQTYAGGAIEVSKSLI